MFANIHEFHYKKRAVMKQKYKELNFKVGNQIKKSIQKINTNWLNNHQPQENFNYSD